MAAKGSRTRKRPSDKEWAAARVAYETTPITRDQIAQRLGVTGAAVSGRVKREGWVHNAEVLEVAQRKAQELLDSEFPIEIPQGSEISVGLVAARELANRERYATVGVELQDLCSRCLKILDANLTDDMTSLATVVPMLEKVARVYGAIRPIVPTAAGTTVNVTQQAAAVAPDPKETIAELVRYASEAS